MVDKSEEITVTQVSESPMSPSTNAKEVSGSSIATSI